MNSFTSNNSSILAAVINETNSVPTTTPIPIKTLTAAMMATARNATTNFLNVTSNIQLPTPSATSKQINGTVATMLSKQYQNQGTPSSSQSLAAGISLAEDLIVDGAELIDAALKNISTTTIATEQETPILKLIHDYLLVFLLVSVMFAMGCGVTLKEVWQHIRRPTSVLVCLLAQFFVVPLLGYMTMTLLDLDLLHATGLLILACCPGGVTSNIFTFMADGDLPLSITMTSIATISALFLMPLNVWLYGRNLETQTLVIPYIEMSMTLIFITIPVVLGMLLNWLLPKYTPYITKAGVLAGFGIICFCQTLEVIIFPDIFFGVPYKLYTAVILFPAFSFMAGYTFGKIFKLDDKICRTIGIEIGIKNVGSALTIISLSFQLNQLKKAWVFPFLYAFSSFVVIFLVTIGFKLARRFRQAQMHKGIKLNESSSDFDDDNGSSDGGNKDIQYKKAANFYEDEENSPPIIGDEMNVVKERLLVPFQEKA